MIYQLETVKAQLLIVHPTVLPVAVEAARNVRLPADRLILFDAVLGSPHECLPDLIEKGLTHPQHFTRFRLKPGEAKTKVALLAFSSGTTGKPKVRDRCLCYGLRPS